jgi:hypothetical protein
METTATAVLSRTAECAALLAIGYQLRAARLFSATDAEVRPGSSANEAHSQLEQHTNHGVASFQAELQICWCYAGCTEASWVSHIACSCIAVLQHVSAFLTRLLARHQRPIRN